MSPVGLRTSALSGALILGGCAGAPPGGPPSPADGRAVVDHTDVATVPPREPLLPPQFARLAGLMPLRSIGVDAFIADNPTFDGRGVLIGIMDSGIDAGVPGLATTRAGDPKLVDLRDFSGEGRILLEPVEPDTGDGAWIGQVFLRGVSRLAGVARAPWYGGVLAERRLGLPPASDLNGDGDSDDLMPLIVGRASDGWVVITDTDGDGTLADERPVRDYAVAGDTFAYGPMTMAVNLVERNGRPELDLFFDNSGHGTHVAGIAAGHDLFGVSDFDGVAPGAQVLGLKISNNARGGISVSGSMVAAMEYAAGFAAQRRLPLVLNLSFGIGNASEGGATIDSIIDAFALRHPDVFFVISAGNDGPGLSTVDFPGSAEFAVTACALYPGVFARPPEPGVRPADDVLGWWSGRGGEVQKPDLCAPGVAFSNVPPWNTGGEVSGGTSMAAPQIAGAAAVLLSGWRQLGQDARAVDVRRALTATASPVVGATTLDVGTGVPNVPAAFRWLRAAHRAGRFSIRALPDGGNVSRATAAYRPDGLNGTADTIQRFEVQAIDGQPFARLRLRSDQPWLRVPESLEFHGEPAVVTVTFDAAALDAPGLYVGTVWAIPDTDTLAGAAFGLTSTITVGRALDSPYSTRRFLGAGQSHRYFFHMDAHAGGMHVDIGVDDREREATLYLFEPGGRPYREASSVNVGGDAPRRESLALRGEDVVPGTYEVVVVAPPLSGVTYALDVRRPPLVVAGIDGDEIQLVNTAAIPVVDAKIEATVTGAGRTYRAMGSGDEPAYLTATVPPWAEWMMIEVALAPALWSRLTDFGVTLFDSSGRLIGEGPLNYPSGRQRISLDSLGVSAVDVELLPAFALSEGQAWDAEVQIIFLARTPLDVLVGDGTGRLDLDGGRSAWLRAGLPDSLPEAPDGYSPVLDVSVWAAGIPSTRRVILEPRNKVAP